MNNQMIKNICILALSVLIIIGVILMLSAAFSGGEDNVIQIELDKDSLPPLEFSDLHLIPGGSCEYVIKFSGRASGKYSLDLKLVKTKDGTLGDFARVKLLSHGEELYDKLLSEAFDGEAIELEVDLKNHINSELQVVYYLPSDVGNEAKGAEAFFELLVSHKN
jgi:hypothetical protein